MVLLGGPCFEHPLGAECSLTILPVMMLKNNNTQERHVFMVLLGGPCFEHPLGAECSLTVLPIMMLKKINTQERHVFMALLGVIFLNIMTGRTINDYSAPSGCSNQGPYQRGGRVVRNAEAFRIPVNSFLT